MKNIVAKLLAAAIACSMAFTAAPVTGSQFVMAADVTASDLTAVQTAVKNFSTELFSQTGDHNILMESYRISDTADCAEAYAGVLAASQPGLKYYVKEASDSVLLFTLQKKNFSLYSITSNVAHEPIGAAAAVKNVKEVRIKGSNLTLKQVSGKKTSYITYKLGPSPSKKSVYSVSGKTYKKGSKKITAKAFNKYVKSYKKMTALTKKFAAANAVEATEYTFYTKAAAANYSEKLYWKNETLLGTADRFAYEPDNKVNPYQAHFEVNGDYYSRYILGPTGSTYEAEAWNKLVRYQMDPDNTTFDFYGEIADGSLNNLTEVNPDFTVASPYADGTDEKLTRYSFSSGPDVIDYVGVNSAGKVAYLAWGTEGSEPEEKIIISYDRQYDGQFMDPMGAVACYPDGQNDIGVGTRTLNIGYEGTNKDLKGWTVTTSSNVILVFPTFDRDTSKTKSNFYFKNADGTKSFLPKADNYGDIFSMLNKETEKGKYDVDPSAKDGFFWTETAE